MQVPPEKWVRGDYRLIAILRHSANDLERRLNANFMADIEEGWGPFRAAGFQMLSGRRFGLTQYLDTPNGPLTEVTCLHDDRFSTDLDEVLESMDMDLLDVATSRSAPAIDSEVKLLPHALWRQDDNGSRSLVQVFSCRANATKSMRAFESAGHKQTYWVEPHSH